MQYVLDVQELGVRLAEVAEQYGHTEEEIAAEFAAGTWQAQTRGAS